MSCHESRRPAGNRMPVTSSSLHSLVTIATVFGRLEYFRERFVAGFIFKCCHFSVFTVISGRVPCVLISPTKCGMSRSTDYSANNRSWLLRCTAERTELSVGGVAPLENSLFLLSSFKYRYSACICGGVRI
jgi:hypothetical protein